MKINIVCLLLIMVSITNAVSQQTNAKGEYIVDFAPFSPPEQDIMREMINKPAMNFMASDQNGHEIILSKLKGKGVILAFWSVNQEANSRLFGYLNSLVNEPQLEVISYGYEPRQELETYMLPKVVNFPVLAQGKFMGEVGYGHDLGVPRLFFIDHNGIIKDIIPSSAFIENQDLYPSILNIIEKAF